MKKTRVLLIIGLIALGIFILTYKPASPTTTDTSPSNNVSIKDGVQYVTVVARGGYRPRTSTIQGGMPTRLIMETNNTYDCSSSLVVRSANYRGILPPNGQTEINLGTPKKGDKIQGVCSMGMYSFSIITN